VTRPLPGGPCPESTSKPILRIVPRCRGILWGVAGAIGLRVVLIFFALQRLELPFLKVVGALLLLWIGIKLMQPEEEGGHGNVEGSTHLLGTIKTIVIADAVMSLDNVVAFGTWIARRTRPTEEPLVELAVESPGDASTPGQ